MNAGRPWLGMMHGIGFDTEGAPEGGGTGGGGGPATGETGPPVETVTMTKAEYDAAMMKVGTREKDQGKRSGLQEWAKGLGADDPAVIAEAFKRYTEQQAAQMTDAEKTKQDADQIKADAAQILQDAKQAKFDATAIKYLGLANAEDPELLAASLTRLGVTVDSTEEEIKAAVAELKKRTPGAFAGKPGGTPAGGNPGKPPAGTPGGKGDGKAEPGQQAREQRERIYGKQKQST